MADEQTPEQDTPETVSPGDAADTPDNDKPSAPPKEEGGSRLGRFKHWYGRHKKWTIPLSVIIVIVILAGVPWTRYNLAGLAHKRGFEIVVLDSTAGTPVSGATVSVDGQSTETSSTGAATFNNIKVGYHNFTVDKKYYRPQTERLLAPIFKQKTVPVFKLVATGRQVKITVSNLVNRNKLGNVDIEVAGVTARTDSSGSAVVVLPAGVSQQKATLSLTGYNSVGVTVQVSGDKIAQDNFSLTPAGKIYFLSNLSGKIDVVKTNLDGTGRQTVLAGTGNEDTRNTVLLASRDWKYLALLSRRAGAYASLYLINTSDDSVTTMDEGNADFDLVGWAGDDFVYVVSRNDVQSWQSGQQALKSYNAATKKITILDQTAATGTDSTNYLGQNFPAGGAYAYDGQVYYVKNWQAGYAFSDYSTLTSKQATFNSVNVDGTGKKAIKSFGLPSGSQDWIIDLEDQVVSPEKTELIFYDGDKTEFYTYADGQVQTDSKMTQDNFYSATYPTYLESPSGSRTFWSDPRDGKNTLFIGDEDGENQKQIATLSDYSPYGWYSDNYLLVAKHSSELYIMAKDGSQTPVKISDYYKPALTLQGYGGGYGGL